MKHTAFDVIVVGGGHAGVEAAHAAARVGARTALVTFAEAGIGVMSCNPAIGGLGKGHLVREIDALDGVMGCAADHAGIQFRLLNRRKGPAVQGPRAQADRKLYRSFVQDAIRQRRGLTVIEGEVADLVEENGTVCGVVLADGSRVGARAVVLTSGTFLGGVIHIGDVSRSGGRVGERASVGLAQRLRALGLPIGRLKTGTPPRLDGRTIDWTKLEMQSGDLFPSLFSFLSSGVTAPQISCGITHTNEHTHDIVRKNLSQSAMYGGHIEGVGPRYCPSIEDKVVRFAEKPSHQVFLEPEGIDDPTVYPNGLSTSLPAVVQEAYIHSILGLEEARITQFGYAIEYDFVDPRALDDCLQVRAFPGLYLAGQINGTTGYEEAAAQGLVAGLNAARAVSGKGPARFSRATSYIGVLVDDLITHGVTEPYRMFTSRAEFRLSLRADNADQRLTAWGREAGCVEDRRWRDWSAKAEELEAGKTRLTGLLVPARKLAEQGARLNPDSATRTGLEALSLADVTFEDLITFAPDLAEVPGPIRVQLKNDAQYKTYLDRQSRDIDALQRDESLNIPSEFSYDRIEGLSFELSTKLSRRKPSSLGQAARMEGMTPAALLLLSAHLRRAVGGSGR